METVAFITIAICLIPFILPNKKLTCGNCKLIQDCNIRETSNPACDRVEPWEEKSNV